MALPTPPKKKYTAEELAKKRRDLHKDQGNRRLYDDEYHEDTVGAAGEIAFAELFNVEVDFEDRLFGDGGVDFTLSFNINVDVKTSRKPYNLLVKANETDRPVDVYVLADYNNGNVQFVGWATKQEVLEAPIGDFGGFGFLTHYIPAKELRSMAELLERCNGNKSQD